MITFLYDGLFYLPVLLVAGAWVLPDEVMALKPVCGLILMGLTGEKKKLRIFTAAFLLAFAVSVLLSKLFLKEWPPSAFEWWDLVWAIVLSLFSYALVKASEQIRMGRFFLSGVVMLYLGWAYLSGLQPDRITVWAAFVLPVLSLADETEKQTAKEGKKDDRRHLLYAIPPVLLMFLLLSFLKTPTEPYDWRFVKRALDGVQNLCYEAENRLFPGTGWGGDKAVMGFSQSGKLWGNVGENGRIAMEVAAGKRGNPCLYLRGGVFDTFNGKEWKRTVADPDGDEIYDTITLVAAVLKETEEGKIEDYLKRASLTERYETVEAPFPFLPEKVLRVSEMGKRADYRVEYYRINRDQENFRSLLLKEHSLTSQEFEEAKRYCGVLDAAVSYDAYKNRQTKIGEVYLPKTEISGRTREWIEESLGSAQTDYEKLERLETVLSGYRYSISGGEMPGNVRDPESFLDAFLFEKKEGNCAHFATAFVLLARSQGYPARYVQGFYTSVEGYGKTEVPASCAHAWPEVYLEGLGWVAFEPTPGYKKKVRWQVSEKEGIAKEAVVGEAANREETDPPSEKEGQSGAPTESREKALKRLWLGHGPSIVLFASAAVLFLLLLFLTDRGIRRYRFLKMSEEEKARELCRQIGMRLQKLGYRKGDAETLSEYGARIAALEPAVPQDFFVLYERILYAGKAPGRKEREALLAILAMSGKWKKHPGDAKP